MKYNYDILKLIMSNKLCKFAIGSIILSCICEETVYGRERTRRLV